ncbi:hypothetical protein BDZ91DRAFT_798120 [Kalaharituber pfeilii]|nr:hypothetical protein BDZ91DRAFT_798120 [Kalaharituber pfeilii]
MPPSAELDILQEMFRAYPQEMLLDALENTGSVDDAIELLLQSNLPALGNPLEPAAIQLQADNFLDEDALRMMEQFEDAMGEQSAMISEDECILQVLNVFPEVCTKFVSEVYNDNIAQQSQNIVEYIITSLLEKGANYPRSENPRKRKRPEDISEDNKYESKNRENPPLDYFSIARKLLQQEFSTCPAAYIDRILTQHKFLAQSYAALTEVVLSYDNQGAKPFEKLKTARKKVYDHEREKLSKTYNELVVELDYAKEKANILKRNLQLESDAEYAAKLDNEEHEKNGMMMECQCCFGEFPFTQMTQCCEGHLFCLDCARRNAENEVGRGRYQLLCMAGCNAEFPRAEMQRFLTEKLLAALSKNEQEEALRMADLEGLTKCPFCDYAAICKPIEEDKEFRCENPECMIVSCRHCQLKSHIPQTCQEASKDGKLSIRHKVEEAMTEALVRTCKKCGNKFIKESGCNKMCCTRCGTLQCYICSETISGYAHFNDPSRGGKATNKCPLFDNTEKRHEDEVNRAAQAAMEKIRAENPYITDEDLEIKLSEAVKENSAAAPEGANNWVPAPVPAHALPFMPPDQNPNPIVNLNPNANHLIINHYQYPAGGQAEHLEQRG